MNGTETMLKHVKAIKHWRKLGKFFINNQLRETFNPVADPYIPKPKEEEVDIVFFLCISQGHIASEIVSAIDDDKYRDEPGIKFGGYSTKPDITFQVKLFEH